MLKNLKEQRTILQKRLDEAKRNKNFKVVHETIEELKIINELRKNTFDERDKIKKQMNNLLAEVRRLNHQTRMLKELIRDKCGVKGKEWYKRLENRTKIKKQLSGKW
ncbi:MAG: hypothetical protein LWW94_11565 [Candidatus Desulfofervidaceae bacterium]|nr:hypothetical protein [Candidatus Desulfofervidaceae bacterium]